MREIERQCKALANRRRLAILKYLKDKPRASVGEIACQINLSFRSTSKHLTVLRAADALETEPSGRIVYYRLAEKQKPVIKYALGLL